MEHIREYKPNAGETPEVDNAGETNVWIGDFEANFR